jgi:uncharacterized membrane protein YbhN (UPF0104 family)
VAILGLEAASFACNLALLRLVLRTKNTFAVVTAGMTGNAVTNSLPGGDALGASVQYQMLAKAGISADIAASGLAVTSIIGLGALFALPIFALPAIFSGVPVAAGLVRAAGLGLIGFAALAAVGALMLTTNRIPRALGRQLQWALNHIPLRKSKTTGLSDRVIEQRDLVAADLGQRWWQAVLFIAGRIGFDYGSLLAALRASGAHPNPPVILLAYAATAVLALLPLTPGGLGIVEASLSGLLVLAGVPGNRAVLAVLAFRLGSYWIPTLSGLGTYFAFRHRFGPVRFSEGAARPSTGG